MSEATGSKNLRASQGNTNQCELVPDNKRKKRENLGFFKESGWSDR